VVENRDFRSAFVLSGWKCSLSGPIPRKNVLQTLSVHHSHEKTSLNRPNLMSLQVVRGKRDAGALLQALLHPNAAKAGIAPGLHHHSRIK
jgi:hypothetical protein